MPTITINGKPITFDGKKMILQVALENGVEIPHYCYHPGLSVVASCRICLAEIAQPNPRHDNKVELIPKLMPTCQTLAADGMEVTTTSPKAIANQKAVMEYLLVNHPLDCPVCDQAGECHLQDYSYRYGHAQSRFEEAKVKQPKKDIGPNVYLYSDRCIMCTRCVRFTREVTGTAELGIISRGHKEQIDIFPGQPLDNELSGNVVDICPVGALLDKDFLFEQRVWFLTQTPSIDGITASGNNIWIEHNQGQIYRVKPRTQIDSDRWWISDEIRYGWKFVHREDRLAVPMRTQYGTQVETDWPRAYQDVRKALTGAVKQHGPGSLAVMVSPMLTCEEAYLLGQLVRGLDPQATLAVGPVPTVGQDKTFPSGYTIYAEKCPNSRGVRRALELLNQGQDDTAVLDFETLLERLTAKPSSIAGVLLTGNYPSDWAPKELVAAVKGKAVVLIDTLPSPLAQKANVLLPGVTWAEKSGTFEDVQGRLQALDQAIAPVPERAKPEGQIALDLIAHCSLGEHALYDPAQTRQQMEGVFSNQVQQPTYEHQAQPDMAYVEL